MTNELKWFRGDITGLRTLAIVPVVAFHAGITAIPGGFVGVDIFYVISGFLITTILVREITNTGRLRIGNFWAKRVRRLAPALALMVLVTLPIAALVISPLQWQNLARDSGSSLLYVSNIVFAQSSTDYFADALAQSPYIHTWSLGVEEQFYVVWPFLILVAVAIARARRVPALTILRGAFALTFAASFALSIVLSVAKPSWAFYLLPTRAWEFALAGLIATLPLAKVIRSRRTSTLVTLAGVVLIVWSLLFIHETDAFPGYIAAVPVAGALLVIIGGSTRTPRGQGLPSRILDTRPMRWIGDVSYSWYLWHWPFIILAAVIFGDELPVKITAALLSLAVGYLAYRFIENPIRFSPRLTDSLRNTFVTVGAVTAGVAVLCAAIYAGGAALIRQPDYQPYAAAAAYVPSDDCDRDPATGIRVCVLGDPTSDTVVMLTGDSHSGHWQDAMDLAAQQAGVQLLARWKSSCPVAEVTVVDTTNDLDRSCATFQQENLDLAEAHHPAAVIISQAAAYDGRIVTPEGGSLPYDEQLERWRAGYDRTLTQLQPFTDHIAVIVDNPRLHFDPNECATRLWHSAADCTSTREDALDQVDALNGISAEVLAAHGIGDTFDVTDRICGPDVCSVVDEDGVPVYRDYNHLSKQWTTAQTDDLAAWLTAMTGAR